MESVDRSGWLRNGGTSAAGSRPEGVEFLLRELRGRTGIFGDGERFYFARNTDRGTHVWIGGKLLDAGGGVKSRFWGFHYLVQGDRWFQFDDAVCGVTRKPKDSQRVFAAHRCMLGVSHPNLVPVWDIKLSLQAAIIIEPYLPYCLETVDLSRQEALRAFVEVAAGLAHLHRCRLVHRDVAAPNVLLSEDGRAMLSDWDSVQEISPGAQSAAWRGGFVRHECLAPEELAEREVGFAGDVWSLAVMIYRMWTKVAYDKPHIPEFIVSSLSEAKNAIAGERMRTCERDMSWPEGTPEDLQALMHQAFEAEPSKRPLAYQMRTDLEKTLASQKGKREALCLQPEFHDRRRNRSNTDFPSRADVPRENGGSKGAVEEPRG
jgi:serine/threonine protein kinase